MVLTNSQIKAIKELGSPGPECINDLLDTIADKDTQIEQLKAQVEAVSISFKELLRICDNIANDGRGFVHGVSWNIREHAKQTLEAIEKNNTK